MIHRPMGTMMIHRLMVDAFFWKKPIPAGEEPPSAEESNGWPGRVPGARQDPGKSERVLKELFTERGGKRDK